MPPVLPKPSLLQKAVRFVKSGFRFSLPKGESDGSKKFAELLMAGGSMGFPGAWTADRLEQVRHYRGWVYIAIKAIAEEVACNPPQVACVRSRNQVQERQLKVLSSFQRRKALTGTQAHEELEPVDSNHPLCELLRNPNEPDVAFDFWFETMMFLELTGNCYWWVVNNRMGVPSEVWVLPSHWVWPMSGNGKLVDYYQVRPYGSPGAARMINFPANEIVAIKYKNPLSKIDGHSPLSAAAEWIDSAESVDSTRWHSFKNGVWPGLVMMLDKDMEDPPQSYIDNLYARLDARSRGETNYDRPLVLPPGVTTTPVTRSPREMDFQQSGDQLKDWIMAVHRVGKSIAGITEEVNYASMIAATANFITRTIRPKLAFIGQVATEKLAKRFDEKLVIYWQDIAPDDPAQKTADMMADFQMAAITPNEVRTVRGRHPYPGGKGDDPMAGGQPLEGPGNPFMDTLMGKDKKAQKPPQQNDEDQYGEPDDGEDSNEPDQGPNLSPE